MADEVGQWICGHPRTPENSRRQGAGYVCKQCRGAPPCSVEGCARKHSARGYCHHHYNAAVRRGEIPSIRDGVCSVADCGKPVRARGLCRTHYQQHNRKHGRVCADNRGRLCDIADCERPAVIRGRCQPHHLSRKAIERYGISEEQFLTILDRQGGVCAVCGDDSPGVGTARWAIDHDHTCCPGVVSCGRCVRGLLCRNCNVGLGHFDDDPDRLLAAAAYLLSRANLLEGLGSMRAVISVG